MRGPGKFLDKESPIQGTSFEVPLGRMMIKKSTSSFVKLPGASHPFGSGGKKTRFFCALYYADAKPLPVMRRASFAASAQAFARSP